MASNGLIEPLLPTSDVQSSDISKVGADDASPEAAAAHVMAEQEPLLELVIEEAPRDTFWPCTFNLAKVIMGAGMMAIPKAFQLLGLILGTAMVVGVGLITYFTLTAILKASEQTGCRSYGALVGRVCGSFAKSVLQTAIFLNCFGLNVVFLVVIGDVLVGAAPDYNGILCELTGLDPLSAWFLDRRLVVAAVTLVILTPLVSMKSMDKLAVVNIIGVLSVVAFAAATVVLAAGGVRTHQEYPIRLAPDWPAFGSSTLQIVMHMAAIIPVILNSDICHQSLHPLVPYLKPYSRQRMNGVMAVALAICNTLYLAIAICMCIVFGPNLQADALDNMNVTEMGPVVGQLAAHVISDTVRVGFVVALVGSFVLIMYPLRQTLVEALQFQPRPGSSCSSGGAAGGSDGGGSSSSSRRAAGELPAAVFYPLTYMLVAMVYMTAVYVPSIWTALSIVGSTASTLQGFLFPSLLVLALEPSRKLVHQLRKAMAVCIALLGLGLFINGFLVLLFPSS